MLYVALIVFLGGFNQSLTGFGAGLVAMAFLPALVGIRLASPLVALVNLVLEAVLLLRFRHALKLGTVWPMVAASALMIPVGVWGLRRLDETLVTRILGMVMSGYSLWALLGLRLPQLQGRMWAVVAGGLGGLLGGAYNTGGPPVILYGNCRRWPPAEFKANLTGYFVLNSVMVCGNHALAGNFSQPVLGYFLVGLPAVLLGVWLGFRLERHIRPDLFRKIVLALLLVMGLRLIF